jgi:hypothetical protein
MSPPKRPPTTAPSPFPDWLPHATCPPQIYYRSSLRLGAARCRFHTQGLSESRCTRPARGCRPGHTSSLSTKATNSRGTQATRCRKTSRETPPLSPTSTILAPKLEAVHCLRKDCCAEFGPKAANDFGEGRTHITRLKLNTLPSKKLSAHPPVRGC